MIYFEDQFPSWTPNGVAFKKTVTFSGSQISSVVSVNAETVGPNGTTNPTFNVDTSVASAATGINIKAAAAGGGVAISTLSSGTNENLTIDAKGTGTIGLNTLGTTSGLVTIGNSTSSAGVAINGPGTITSASANALAVGPNGTTNPALQVIGNVSSQATGLQITPAAAGSGITINTISSGTNEGITIAGKGNGPIYLTQNGTQALQIANTIAYILNGRNLNVGSVFLSGSATGGLGYQVGSGAGGAVTQLTSRTTGVTNNFPTGQVTLFSAAGSATAASFTVTDSRVAATDVIVLNVASGTNLYEVFVTAVAAGSFQITFLTTGGTATDAPVINYAIIKGSAT